MATSTPFISAQDLRNALSITTYVAIFDDEHVGSSPGALTMLDNSPQVRLCIRRAHARVISRLGAIYTKIPSGTDETIDSLLFDAELNYAMGIAFDRHAEYVRTYGEEPRRKSAIDQAERTMELLQDALLRLVEAPPEPKPANVGGAVLDTGTKVFLGDCNGTSQSGDF